jgi:Protein of unknown function (DUF2934)
VGAPAGDTSEARFSAEACLTAAKDEGIARADIEEETGDLVAYMGAVIANLGNHPEGGAPTPDNNREEVIRTKAFYIWLDEGCPEGRADAHWQMAIEFLGTEEGRFDPPVTQAPAKSGGKSRKLSKR